MRQKIILAVCLLVAAPALAETEPEAAPATCQSQATTLEMLDCQEYRLAEAERVLALAVSDAAAAFPDYAFNLDIAQENWLRYRDAHCHFLVAWDHGGTIAPVNAMSCKIAETQRRTAELSGDPGQ
jgi:uncharacterized protein YecT (DUF1311 family)